MEFISHADFEKSGIPLMATVPIDGKKHTQRSENDAVPTQQNTI